MVQIRLGTILLWSLAILFLIAVSCSSVGLQTKSPSSPLSIPASTQPILPTTSASSIAARATNVINYTYKVVKVYPHDKAAFTEGLVINQGILYEGTGLNGSSSLRRVDLATGKLLQSAALPEQYFGEGITAYQNYIFQLTWQSEVGFVYDKNSFNLLRQFAYTGEGWGLTNDQSRLIMSDGTAKIRFLDPQNLQTRGSIEVKNGDLLVTNINELEYIKGKIWANIWLTNRVALIDPQNGQVTGWLDLTGLLATQNYTGPVDVLNGIAYDSISDQIYVTGKYYPYLFQIELVAKSS